MRIAPRSRLATRARSVVKRAKKERAAACMFAVRGAESALAIPLVLRVTLRGGRRTPAPSEFPL
jgi:hypothetical protein